MAQIKSWACQKCPTIAEVIRNFTGKSNNSLYYKSDKTKQLNPTSIL